MTRLTLALVLISFTALAADNPLAGLFSPDNVKKGQQTAVTLLPGDKPDSITLRFAPRDTPGSITVPVPESGRDWSRAGAFTFEFVSDSTIRFDLQIRNRKGETTAYRVQPYQNVPVKAAIDSSFLTREYMNNRQYRGHWLSSWGNHIDLTAVESLTIRMSPNREVTLKIGPMTLTPDAVTDEVFLKKPVVDEFGQWIGLDWPGKVRSLPDLRRAWKEEDAALAKPDGFGFSSYGGWKQRKERATGFFHTAQIDGRWWLVDPEGHLFFSAGPDCVRYADPTRVTGREALFSKLPEGSGETTDFYTANARLRYGAESFVSNWKTQMARRLKAWGFNTIANWSAPVMFESDPPLPFVTNVRIGRSAKNWQGFPDAWSDEFLQSAEADARQQCDRYRNQKQLIGYFIGNEPRWPNRNLVDLILKDPETSATQSFARGFLAEKGDTPETRAALLETLSRRYFQRVCDAIRKADPNHLILGIRWAGSAPDPVLRANDVFDVFSINIYSFEPQRQQLDRIYGMLKKPLMIGEFHFGAAERGYAPSLVLVKDQTERGAAYQYYFEHAAAHPAMIGIHYFQTVDQPVTGRYDGENYNLGFINQQDIPYPEMVSFAKATHRRMYQVHAATLAPTDRAAKVR